MYALQELQAAFQAEHSKSKKPKLLLTAAVGADPAELGNAYNVKHISNAVDLWVLLLQCKQHPLLVLIAHNSQLCNGSFK